MNSVDVAYKILRQAGRPLHYVELARRVTQSGLWVAGDEAPYQTIKRDIDQEIRNLGKRARFTHIGTGVYAANPSACHGMMEKIRPDFSFVKGVWHRLSFNAKRELIFIVEAWERLPTTAKHEMLQVIREALGGETDEIDDPVVASILPDGPKVFPKDFLNPDIAAVHKVELPEEDLAVRQLPGGDWVVESHFGFRHPVRNETEGMFIVYAHGRGIQAVDLPGQMIQLFKAVKTYEEYLRTLWRDLYHAYGRECGDQDTACNLVKAAFDTLGLPLPPEARSPAPADTGEPTERERRQATRTPKVTFHVPIPQALNELGKSGRTAKVVKRVNEIMDDSQSAMIGGPDPAPKLVAETAPSEERTAGGGIEKDTAGKDEKEQKRYEFFEQLLECCRQKTSLFSNVAPVGYQTWVNAGAGKTGMLWSFNVTRKTASVYLCLCTSKPAANRKRFKALFAHKRGIEKRFGERIQWDLKAGRKQQYLRSLCPIGGLDEEAKWRSIQDDLVDRLIRMESSLRKIIKGID